EFEVFADGFAGVDTIVNTSDAAFRPMAVAMGPDGSLFVGESEQGWIWKITYKGDKNSFSDKQLAKMEAHKKLPHIKNPDLIRDNLSAERGGKGSEVYFSYCSTCHQTNGEGDGNRFPPLVESEWVNGDKDKLIGVVLNGLQGEVTVKGKTYNNPMPPHNFLKDEDVASVLTYIRKTFNDNDEAITAEEVKKARAKHAPLKGPK
ncbi:MAG TPA: c-type cytochrome, partial [Flavitalea sp.]|nr:c-type cytochrome [Flavitalea sp.]